MSIPPHYATTTRPGGREVIEDCRDFLRTGRCKYGASCKYNHPANVQNGGGMKVPINPSEPLFPIRPNEPVCQYYMKHGTCKFGQACKFHHPPQATQHVANAPGAVVVMNVARKHDSPQLVLNPVGSVDASANQQLMVQFLPQRPDEADCIYFLKNGRCRYGATCRYHHPLNYHQRRAEEQRRHHEQRRNQAASAAHDQRYQGAQIHYVQQPVAGYSQGHVFVGDNPVALVSVSDRDGGQSYQQVPIITGPDGTQSYCLPMTATATVGTEQGSSTTSISSSVSNLDQMGTHNDGLNSSLWNRRSGSGGSLNAYIDTRGQSRQILPHSASDGNIARRSRAASHGSASDPSVASVGRTDSQSSWRVDQGPSPDQSTHSSAHHSPHYGPRMEPAPGFAGDDSRMGMRTRPPGVSGTSQSSRQSGPRPRNTRTRGSDEGFTMMTSALLNMLDTPEEVSAESCSEEDFLQARVPHPNEGVVDPSLFGRLSLNPNVVDDNRGYVPHAGGDPRVLPPSTGEDMVDARQATTRQRQGPPAPSHPEPDAGIYFP